ncbi:hypothetical protein [Streptomyces sp. NPDC005141]
MPLRAQNPAYSPTRLPLRAVIADVERHITDDLGPDGTADLRALLNRVAKRVREA